MTKAAKGTMSEALGVSEERVKECLEISMELVEKHIFTTNGNNEATFVKAIAERTDLSTVEKVWMALKAGTSLGKLAAKFGG